MWRVGLTGRAAGAVTRGHLTLTASAGWGSRVWVTPVHAWATRPASTATSATAGGPDAPPRVCIVGTGPAGFYTAKYLLKEHPTAVVDLVDALPTPFGLVRSGVAPDHPEVKSVQRDFAAVAGDDRVRFMGNVALGRDVTVEELRSVYHAVVLAYGAAADRMLGIPGERLRNVHAARAFVNWYNGHPDFASFAPDLSVEDVVIVGQGNVAIDCARILCKTPDELAATDITDAALAVLRASRVKRVHVIGRRGHVQAAFTMKELREVTKLADAALVMDVGELDRGATASSGVEMEAHRAKKRMDALLREEAGKAGQGAGTKSRQLHLRFCLAPTAILPRHDAPDAVGAVQCVRTRLEGPPDGQRAVPTEEVVTLPAGMVLRSIGYKSIPTPGVPFDERKAVVCNEGGRVVTAPGTPLPGVYVTGWLKRGPSGIIGSNIPDAKETVAALVADWAAGGGGVPSVQVPLGQRGVDVVRAMLAAKGNPRAHPISWQEYQRIEAEEVARGAAKGKPREKLTDVAEMLRIVQGPATG